MDKSLAGLKDWALAHLRWYRQSSFRLSTAEGKTVYIDPWRVPAREGRADLILVTHPHGDHLDRGSVNGLSGPATQRVMPRSCAEPGWTAIAAGETLRAGPAVVTAVPAYNIGKPFHPRAEAWVGYLLEVDGIRIYHAGDTDLIPEMNGLSPDIALLPIGGMFAMNARAAERAAAALEATLCIPMHFGMLLGGRGAGARFARRMAERGLALPRA